MTTIDKDQLLHTPSDLNEADREHIGQTLNVLVADLLALYIKTKNFHWHMSGRHFRDYHLLLDQQADQILATVDPVAERVRKLGEQTIHSIGEIVRLQRVEDSNQAFVAPVKMLEDLMEDNKALAHHLREAHQDCEKGKDVATASLLEIYIDEAERRTWFLFETTRQMDQ